MTLKVNPNRGSSHRPHKSWPLIMAGTAALALAMGIGRFAYTPILPFMISEVGFGATEGGLIASWNFVGYCIGSLIPILPFFNGRIKIWFFGAVAVSIFTTGCMGLVQDLNWFVVIRFISGIASAFTLIFGTSLILPSIQALGKITISTSHFTGVGLGMALSAIVVSLMGAFNFSWNELWYGVALLALLLAIPVIVFTPDEMPRQKPKKKTEKGIFEFGFITITTAYGLFGFGYVILGTFISAMARSIPELISTEPYVWLLVGLSGIPTVMFWPWLGQRISGDFALMIACAVEAIGIYVAVVVPGQTGILIAAVLLGATFMGITALALLEGQARFNGTVIVSTAVLTSAFGVGQMVGPYLAGLIIDRTGSFATAMIVSSGALVVAALLMLDPRRLAVFRH
jgi:MFS family permease